jgi:hypothetical protein
MTEQYEEDYIRYLQEKGYHVGNAQTLKNIVSDMVNVVFWKGGEASEDEIHLMNKHLIFLADEFEVYIPDFIRKLSLQKKKEVKNE